jgi:hypothetical protein
MGCFIGVSEEHSASFIRVDVNMVIRHSHLTHLEPEDGDDMFFRNDVTRYYIIVNRGQSLK